MLSARFAHRDRGWLFRRRARSSSVGGQYRWFAVAGTNSFRIPDTSAALAARAAGRCNAPRSAPANGVDTQPAGQGARRASGAGSNGDINPSQRPESRIRMLFLSQPSRKSLTEPDLAGPRLRGSQGPPVVAALGDHRTWSAPPLAVARATYFDG
jgi:hypothetical protein